MIFRKYLSQVLFFLGGLALYLLLGLFLWWLLQLYVDPSSIKDPSKEATAKKDLLQALGFIMAGVAGAIGIYFTWRGQRLTQESTQEELRITREGQITERFTRAIDQLGKVEGGKKLYEIRIGGIYALERIARESKEDYWPIMEILTAYVRHNAPLPPEADQERTEAATDEQRAMEGPVGKAETKLSAVDPDIQAIMTVLRRRTSYHKQVEYERLDLSETNLTQAVLSGADLSGAVLTGAIFYEADLTGADLSHQADLYEANLSGADLSGADLSGANFYGADLTQADLTQADLTDANLYRADLSGAVLYGAVLYGANLYRANLYRADLSGAVLPEGKLYRAEFSEEDLSEDDLTGAYRLTQEQLEQAKGNENTQLPSHLKAPAHWGVKTAEQPE
jgi:hypothetical protein